jgi:hypothetical protein
MAALSDEFAPMTDQRASAE